MPGVTSDVLEANDRFYAAFNNHDFEAMDALWATSVEVACVHPGWMRLAGREEVMASWAAILRNPDQSRLVPGDARVVFTGASAVVHCREFVAGTPLVATNIFVREEDGAWRLIHHHSSPVMSASS